MPTYYWKFQECFNTGKYVDVYIEIVSDEIEKSKHILMNYIIKMSRFGIPIIFITPKDKTIISHSNDVRASNLPFISIDYQLFQKILSLQPSLVFELNHQANPFIPNIG